MKLYNAIDHSQDIWYTVSFDFKQAASNQYYTAQEYTVRIAFFDMDRLDAVEFPNDIGAQWDYPFGACM